MYVVIVLNTLKKNSTSTNSRNGLTIKFTNSWTGVTITFLQLKKWATAVCIYLERNWRRLHNQLVENLTFVCGVPDVIARAGDGAGKQYKCKKNKLHDSDTHGARLNSPFLFSSFGRAEIPKCWISSRSQSVSAQDKISNITIGYPTWARL
jgi:hypothetical protein